MIWPHHSELSSLLISSQSYVLMLRGLFIKLCFYVIHSLLAVFQITNLVIYVLYVFVRTKQQHKLYALNIFEYACLFLHDTAHMYVSYKFSCWHPRLDSASPAQVLNV